MNKQIEAFARDELKKGLASLSEGHHKLFKRMYSHKNIDKDINDVVDLMPADKLDLAMQQVERTIMKLNQRRR